MAGPGLYANIAAKKARIKAEEKYSQKVVCDSYVKVLNLCVGKNL